MGAVISDAGEGQNRTQCEVEDLIDIPQSRDAVTWDNILKDNRSSFMINPDGSLNHDALPTT